MMWPGYHLDLVSAVVDARETLRLLLPSLPAHHQRTVGTALMRLNVGLKARDCKTPRRMPAAPDYSPEQAVDLAEHPHQRNLPTRRIRPMPVERVKRPPINATVFQLATIRPGPAPAATTRQANWVSK